MTITKDMVLKSNYGHGPLAARVLSVGAMLVYLERWDTRGNRKTRRTKFFLTRKFFGSGGCGWKEPTP